MSYTSLCAVDILGNVSEHSRFNNANRGMMLALNHLTKKHIVEAADCAGPFSLMQHWDTLGKRFDTDEVNMSWYEFNCACFSFDMCIVKRDEMITLARSLRRLALDMTDSGHLNVMAKTIEKIHEWPGNEGVCLLATSDGENPWVECVNDHEEQYNVYAQDKHWLASLRKEQ